MVSDCRLVSNLNIYTPNHAFRCLTGVNPETLFGSVVDEVMPYTMPKIAAGHSTVYRLPMWHALFSNWTTVGPDSQFALLYMQFPSQESPDPRQPQPQASANGTENPIKPPQQQHHVQAEERQFKQPEARSSIEPPSRARL